MPEIVKPQKFSILLDQAVELTRARPWSTLLTVGGTLAAVTALYTLAMAVAFGGMTMTSEAELATADLAGPLIGLGAMLIMVPVMLAAQMVGYCVLAVSATRRVFGEEPSLGQCLSAVVRPAFIGTSILAVVMMIISLFFFILPFFVVSALLSLLFPVMLIEGRYGIDAITRSSSLAWRNPGGVLRTAPLLLIMAVHGVFFGISSMLSLAVQLPYQIANQVIVFREALKGDAGDPSAIFGLFWLQVPVAAIATFVSTIAAYYLFHCLALMFRDVREGREATSIAETIQAWEQTASATPEP